MVESCYHKFTGNISEVTFLEKIHAFSGNLAWRAHGIVFWSWDAFLVFDRKPLPLLTETRRNTCLEIPPEKKCVGKVLFILAVRPEQAVLL